MGLENQVCAQREGSGPQTFRVSLSGAGSTDPEDVIIGVYFDPTAESDLPFCTSAR